MRDIFILFLYAIVTIIRLGKPGGLRCVVAEAVLMRHQLLILNRGRKRLPTSRSSDRIVAGLCTLLMRPIRVLRSAIVLKIRDSPEFSQNAGRAKVPAPIFTKTSSKTGSQRADEGADRRRRRNETTPSDLGLSAHCSADCFSLRRRYRQRRGPPDPHHSLPSGSRIGRSVLAFLYGSR